MIDYYACVIITWWILIFSSIRLNYLIIWYGICFHHITVSINSGLAHSLFVCYRMGKDYTVSYQMWANRRNGFRWMSAWEWVALSRYWSLKWIYHFELWPIWIYLGGFRVWMKAYMSVELFMGLCDGRADFIDSILIMTNIWLISWKELLWLSVNQLIRPKHKLIVSEFGILKQISILFSYSVR